MAQKATSLYSELSSKVYTQKIAQLNAYKVPKTYDDKSSQAWYDEILTGRKNDLLETFKDDEIINDSLLLKKCNAVLKRISTSNSKYNFDSIKVYINRSLIPNAVCYGEGTIMINLGLLLWVDNDDELAFILAHEFSHQLLNHADQKVKKSIAALTSEDFVKELKKIKKAEYGKYQRYKDLMKDLNLESSKHSRFKESEADSLGIIFANNAGYNTKLGSRVLLKLDNADEIFESKKVYNTKDFFAETGVDISSFTTTSKYNGLSKVAIVATEDKLADSLKTHPDCSKRYEAINGKGVKPIINCCSALTNDYKEVKERAMVEITRYVYENGSLTFCIHMCAFALKNNYDATYYKSMLATSFSKIYYNDKNLKRFNSVNVAASPGTNLKELQDYLFAVSNEDLEKLALYFLDNNKEKTGEDFEFAYRSYNIFIKEKDKEITNETFSKKFPKSKYLYLITPPKK